MSRQSELEYATKETRTTVRLNLDGTGQAEIGTGIAFFDHMLEQLTFHGLFDLKLECRGD
ncbi:MAG: imidazoleglycerol-phosphate dehydratase, partial [Deltaproteobacteria bacterium]|nr:imidazoleglycerol-phosphate dehydratase [Deltaproteobacteria bacterium]